MKETLPISLSLTNFLYLFYLYIIFQPPGREGQQHQSPSQLVGLSNLSRCRQGTSTLIQLSCCHPVSLCGFYIFLRHMYFFCPLKLQCCHLRPWTRLDCKWIRLSTQSTTQHSFQLALLDSRCWRSTCSDWLCLSSTCLLLLLVRPRVLKKRPKEQAWEKTSSKRTLEIKPTLLDLLSLVVALVHLLAWMQPATIVTSSK